MFKSLRMEFISFHGRAVHFRCFYMNKGLVIPDKMNNGSK